MKLVTALSTAAFIVAPAAGLAKDMPYPDWGAIARTAGPSAPKLDIQQPADMQKAGTKAEPVMAGAAMTYPYPDWPAIAKTAPTPQAAGPKAPEPGAPSAAKGEAGVLEKTERALETFTGRSATMEEEAAEVGVSQTKPAGIYPYPDWPAIAKTGAGEKK